MTAALGAVALWTCLDLKRYRLLVIALGIVMAFLVIACLYSLIIDGMPGSATLTYLLAEITMAGVFLLWPPS